MAALDNLISRSNNRCEFCQSTTDLSAYVVPPKKDETSENSVLVCRTCADQIQNPSTLNADHWQCLSQSMWSEYPAVQVMAWRILNAFALESWAQDLLDQLYLEDDIKTWALASPIVRESDDNVRTAKDSNGTPLLEGDSVTLIKDLDVKGANFTAKRGTLVKNITLTDDPGLIEGRVNGIKIVLKTEFLKKASVM